MQHRKLSLALAGIVLAAASFAANADILFTNLGPNAPPSSIGGLALTPFDPAIQAAVPNGTTVTSIPGSPIGGTLTSSPSAVKRTIGVDWTSVTWSGYAGPVYQFGSAATTLTLPANSGAFYFYLQPFDFGESFNYTVTTNSGTTSGSIAVPSLSNSPGYGFAFHGTAGEIITSVTISPQSSGFAIGRFGIGLPTTCTSEGYTSTKLDWCKNICERGYTGATLDIWIHRWINRYRDLPYCAVGAPL